MKVSSKRKSSFDDKNISTKKLHSHSDNVKKAIFYLNEEKKLLEEYSKRLIDQLISLQVEESCISAHLSGKDEWEGPLKKVINRF